MRFTASPRYRKSGHQQREDVELQSYSGRFVDVRSLARVLFTQPFTLEKLCKLLKVDNPKQANDQHGKALDREYIEYAARDVQATWECFEKLKSIYYQLGLTLPINNVYSEASLGKGYFKDMNIRSWQENQPDFLPEVTAIIMSTYYGGRSEVRIRHKVVPVICSDFRSMYPTVCSLMNLWDFVISEGVDDEVSTAATQTLLNDVTLRDMHDPKLWPRLRTLVCILPEADIFPVRAAYARDKKDPSYTIGVNYLSGQKPLWYTLADCIASKLLTGKAPKIIRALTFKPRNMQDGLKSIAIQGKPEWAIDPTKQDFLQALIVLRGQVLSAMDTLPVGDPRWDGMKAEEKNLKITANATTYGIYMQLDQEPLADFEKAVYWDIEGNQECIRTDHYEKPGPCYHPLLGTLITGAARLMLAMAECLGREQGLEWAFCDTDSWAFANYHNIDPMEFDAKVRSVQSWFDALNPYGDARPLLKFEYYKRDMPLYCWAISAKRYALFNKDEHGRLVIRKASLHGLGHYVEPYNDKYIQPGTQITDVQIRETELKRWHLDFWYNILAHALDGDRLDFNPAEATAFNIPAACYYAVTSPHIMHLLKQHNEPNGEPKPLAEQIRPFGFILSYRQKKDRQCLIFEQASGYIGKIIEKPPRILSPFSKDIREAVKKCFDSANPHLKVYPSQLETMQDALAKYNLRPESKFSNARPFDKGLTQRRHIEFTAVHYIGKEANLIDEQTYLGAMPEAQITYGLGRSQALAVFEAVYEAIKNYGVSRFVLATGRTRQHIQDIFKGRAKPSGSMLLELHEAIPRIKATFGAEISDEQTVLSETRQILSDGLTNIRGIAREIDCDASYLAKLVSGKKPLSNSVAVKLKDYIAKNKA